MSTKDDGATSSSAAIGEETAAGSVESTGAAAVSAAAEAAQAQEVAQAGPASQPNPAGAGAGVVAGVVAEAIGPDGEQLVLRRAAGGYEILRDGRVAIASAERRSERELVNVGMVPLRDRQDITVLVAGLGMGYLLAALLESPRVVRVDVVEHSAAIVEWNRTFLAPLHGMAPLDDPRVHVHTMGFSDYLRAVRYQAVPGLSAALEGGGYLAVLMDLDDGPNALSRGGNADLYTEEGLADIEEAIRPGGVIALWSAQRETELMARLHGRFQNIAEIAFPVDVPSSAGLDYLYRARRRAIGGATVKPGNRAQA